MLTKLAKLALVATAFAPVLLTYAMAYALRGEFWPNGFVLVAVAALLVVLCILVIRAARNLLELLPFPVQAVKTADSEIVGFILAYLLPLVNSSTNIVDARILAFVLVMFFAVVWSTHSYHFNPVLGFLGYHFYEVESTGSVTYLMVTKRDLRRTREVASVVQLTEYMVLDASKERPHG